MFARVSTIEGSADRLDEGIAHLEQAGSTLEELQGFRGGYVLADRASGKLMTLTLWETREALDASSTPADHLRAQGAERAGATQSPRVEVFEVAHQVCLR